MILCGNREPAVFRWAFSTLRSLPFNRHFSKISEFIWRPPSPVSIDTGIQIYNCVARTTVPLVFPNKQIITCYTCGPTVYDSAHIGHASCYVKLDIIQRLLRDQFNVNLVTAMNITDVDDKIIKKSAATKEPWQELVKRYEAEFWRDFDALGIRRPDIVLRVTDRMPEIIEFVDTLLRRDAAYIGRDGSVYFNNKLTSGKLQNIGEVRRSTDTPIEQNKRAPQDFVLWKASKPGEPAWPVPWSSDGAGRPGWHTECSAMASKIFGQTIDIHGGGMDLRYPHHENEENQCCIYHDTPQWVNYWIHIGQLHYNDAQKMSKSLKNTISIEAMLSNFTSNQFRMACLLSNYRNIMEFNDESMLLACNVLKRIDSFVDDSTAFVRNLSGNCIDGTGLMAKIQETSDQIDISLKSDFNTSKSIVHLLELISFANKTMNNRSTDSSGAIGGCDALLATMNFVIRQLNIFGCGAKKESTAANAGVSDNFVNDIVMLRDTIRNEAIANKDERLFKVCNAIRAMLGKNSIEVKDLPKDADGISKSRWLLRAPHEAKPNVTKKPKMENSK